MYLFQEMIIGHSVDLVIQSGQGTKVVAALLHQLLMATALIQSALVHSTVHSARFKSDQVV